MSEAHNYGWPLVRQTWLHYESDAATLTLDKQFLLGADLLAAPVLTSGASQVSAYLPEGMWLSAFSGNIHNSTGGWLTVQAPLGKPAAFIRLDPASHEPRSSLRPFIALASQDEPLTGARSSAAPETQQQATDHVDVVPHRRS